MPAGFKRMGEKFRQALGISAGQQYGKEWKPTSNSRNEAMIAEARRFAQHIKTLHKQVASLDITVDGTLATYNTVLGTPLPRAYDEVATGGALPVDKEQHPVGAYVNLEVVAAAQAEMRQRLQTEVLAPLEQWLAAYRMIKERNKRCEEVRLDLDTKRRATLTLTDKYERQKSSNKPGVEKALVKAQTTNDKMTRLAQRYAEIEAEVFNALLTLIRDTAELRDYMAVALAIVQRCFSTTYQAFDLSKPVPQPLLPAPAPMLQIVAPPNPMLAFDTMNTMRRSTNSPTSVPALPAPQWDRSQTLAVSVAHSSSDSSPPQMVQSRTMPARSVEGALPRAPASPNVTDTFPSAYSEPNGGAPAPAVVSTPASTSHSRTTSAATVTPPPWYSEAKQNARAPVYGDDSDDEHQAESAAAAYSSRPSSPPMNPFRSGMSHQQPAGQLTAGHQRQAVPA